MKTAPTAPAPASADARVAHFLSHGCLAVVLVGLCGWAASAGRAEAVDYEQEGVEVLTRGPVHEAFAGMVSYDPEPGIVVAPPPPEPIEEIPPEERPEGDDVAWIPGYWGWDDERSDFLWISGTWRALPPGRAWVAGYWRESGQGHQWISGYWADAKVREITYLPPPPATLEIGANIAAPSIDYGWTPGCWVWFQGRYAWRAGYWAPGRAEWVWVPAYYVWTPRGVIFVEGFWDYPLEHRGMLFAPVYYQSRGYARRGYSYSPRIAINLSIFNDHLFLRPSFHHYYFGDYYSPRYDDGGFYASFTFQSGRHGYDPFYSHNRWEHRQDRDWGNRFQASYRYRRDHEDSRPPRTWAAQVTVNRGTVAAGQARVTMAAPLEQLAARRENPVRFQRVDQGDRQKLAQRGREVQQSREQRRKIEAAAVVPSARQAGEAIQPAKVSLPRSPIVAQPARRNGKGQPPPAAQRAPKPDPKVQPRAEAPGRRQDAGQPGPPSDARQPDRERRNSSERKADAPRGTSAQTAAEPAANPAAPTPREQALRKEQQAQVKAVQDSAKRHPAAPAVARGDAPRETPPPPAMTQQFAEGNAPATERAPSPARDPAVDTRRDAPRNNRREPARLQPDTERRGEEAAKGEAEERKQKQAAERARVATKSEAQSGHNERQVQVKAQQEAEMRDKEVVAKVEQAAREQNLAEVRRNAAKPAVEPPRLAQAAPEHERQEPNELAARARVEAGDRVKVSEANAQDEARLQARREKDHAQAEAARRGQGAEPAAKAKVTSKGKPTADDEEEAKKEKRKRRDG